MEETMKDYEKELEASFRKMNEGDVLEATVVRMDDGQGNILLSRKEANAILAWDVLAGYMEEKKNLNVKISEVVNAGAIAYVEGIRGFIPASQLDLSYVEDTESYQGRKLTVRVTTVDPEKEKLILSAKEVLKVGDKVKVKVLNTNDGKISLSIKAAAEVMEAEEIENTDTESYSSGESLGTSLGDLFAKLNLYKVEIYV